MITLINKKDKVFFQIDVPFMFAGVCKQIPSRQWLRGKKVWEAKDNRLNCEYIKKSFPQKLLTQEALEHIEKRLNDTSVPPFVAAPPVETRLVPKKHQKQALDKLHNLRYAALFMDMGTGKTKTVIDLLTINRALFKNIVIFCPVSVMFNWELELAKHCTFEHTALNIKRETKKFTTIKGVEILIVGIESMSSSKTTIEKVNAFVDKAPTACVVDEAHYIKTHDSRRTQEIYDVGQKCVLRYILTGTPVDGNPLDLFSLMRFLSDDILPTDNFYAFKHRYTIEDSNKVKLGYKNLDELRQIIDRYIFICKKSDVLDLPPKTFEVRTLDMTQRQLDALKELKRTSKVTLNEAVKTKDMLSVLTVLTMMQRVSSGCIVGENGEIHELVPIEQDVKIKEVLSILDATEGSFIIWARSKFEIQRLSATFEGLGITHCTFTGDTPEKERAELVRRFQAGEFRVFISNTQTGGAGIELTKASNVIYFSNSFKYGDRMQSEDRCHRIGQSKNVHYIDLIYNKSVDVKIYNALREKKNVADYILGVDIAEIFS